VEDKKAFERKHFFINRELQGRYMLTFLIPMLILLVFMLFTLYIATQSVIGAATRIVKEDIENTITAQLQDKTEPVIGDYEGAFDNIRDYLRTFETNPRYRKAFLSTLLWVFGAGVLIVIVQIVLLTIFISHKIAGPLYRLEKVCHALIEGNYNERVKLRKGDEMQNLAQLMESVIQLTKERLVTLRDEKDEKKRAELVSSLRL